MSHNQEYPQPEQQPLIYRAYAEAYNKDAGAIDAALQYVNEVAPTWILEPSEVTVEQPGNQEDLIDSLQNMLGEQQDGEQLQRQLQGNLAGIKHMQTQPDHAGIRRLDIKAGYNVHDLRQPGDNLSRNEYEVLRDNSWSDREIIDDADQSNVMVTGLLVATGAETLRNDVGEDGGISKLYKGTLGGQPVYFEEKVLPRIRGEYDSDRETTTYLERSLSVVSEQTARHILNALSAQDADVLRSVGVEIPTLDAPEYNPATYPNRSRMIETVELYATFNPVGEEVKATENKMATLAVTASLEADAVLTEELERAQAERDEQVK